MNRSKIRAHRLQIFDSRTVIFSRLVIDTLKDVDPDRKCFRMVGGVLVERTVKEVLPALINNREQVKIRRIHTNDIHT